MFFKTTSTGEGGMAGECQRMVYLVPTKDGPPKVPGEGGMAGEYFGQAVEEGLHLGPAQDGRVRHVQVHLKNQKGNSVNFFFSNMKNWRLQVLGLIAHQMSYTSTIQAG
jgi:hypothetical protein